MMTSQPASGCATKLRRIRGEDDIRLRQRPAAFTHAPRKKVFEPKPREADVSVIRRRRNELDRESLADFATLPPRRPLLLRLMGKGGREPCHFVATQSEHTGHERESVVAPSFARNGPVRIEEPDAHRD